jgi:hypothetical protein
MMLLGGIVKLEPGPEGRYRVAVDVPQASVFNLPRKPVG